MDAETMSKSKVKLFKIGRVADALDVCKAVIWREIREGCLIGRYGICADRLSVYCLLPLQAARASENLLRLSQQFQLVFSP